MLNINKASVFTLGVKMVYNRNVTKIQQNGG